MSAGDSLGDQLQLLPFYLLADQSGSMESDIEFLTGGLQDLVDEARSNSLAYSKIRLSVIGFGSSVTAHLELADLRKIDRMPVLPATEEYTRYDLAFEDLRVRIDRDVDLIKATNNAALRPAVFFLTDGKPNPPDQPWREALSTVRDDSFRRRPNIVAFGVRDADANIIREIASRPDWAFVTGNASRPQPPKPFAVSSRRSPTPSSAPAPTSPAETPSFRCRLQGASWPWTRSIEGRRRLTDAGRRSLPPYQPVGRLAVGGEGAEPEASPSPGASFRSAAYRPDSTVDSWAAGPFMVRGASVRGDAHRYRGVARQDEMCLAWQDEAKLLVVAVADGVSSAPLSHVGASTVCRYAVERLLREGAGDGTPDWRDVLEGCAWALVDTWQRLESLPAPDPAEAERQLATTICVAVLGAIGGRCRRSRRGRRRLRHSDGARGPDCSPPGREGPGHRRDPS